MQLKIRTHFFLFQVKKRRLEREREKQERDDEEALLQRQKEAAQFKEWGMSEDMFHLEQATLRSKIRIKDGRGEQYYYCSLLTHMDLGTFVATNPNINIIFCVACSQTY
jgi:hypothetical protein